MDEINNLAALIQGIYFLMTGPKTDFWLVKTVGLILALIGAVILYAQQTAVVNVVIMLAIGAALSLNVMEVVYMSKRIISPIYLADAAAKPSWSRGGSWTC